MKLTRSTMRFVPIKTSSNSSLQVRPSPFENGLYSPEEIFWRVF